ncbi:helix-turn-helix domain-containing protein [Prosthecobacter dejongeii]|uniref:Transcriptional regulator with XRE-family HTH domain n=1 Tax=Prosthecobacter dejongeii TaxID=48465 RepID=A0A7W7YL70_9BACT|nr:helix-turn-helix domain-containing protein [Prosthecobacter dejongeii]MBB5038236.1 transcriptional regulator with XRE-family HTH domain [Prosthecobacter dejongeii]
MTGEQLRTLRESRDLTREELAAQLGNCSASGIVKWEGGISPVPQWVEEKMMGASVIKFPLSELYELLMMAKEENISFDDLLSEAIQDVLVKRRSKSQAPNSVNTGAKTAAPAVSSSNITKMPPQHIAAEDEKSQAADPKSPKKVSYTSGKRKKA